MRDKETIHSQTRSRKMYTAGATGILLGFALLAGMAAHAQMPVGLPARAPGYDRYYHGEQPSTAFATRWGYLDGYQDGKRDRDFGKDPDPENQDRYKTVPDHGLHPDIPRPKYKTLYRAAYLKGYEYGSKF